MLIKRRAVNVKYYFSRRVIERRRRRRDTTLKNSNCLDDIYMDRELFDPLDAVNERVRPCILFFFFPFPLPFRVFLVLLSPARARACRLSSSALSLTTLYPSIS